MIEEEGIHFLFPKRKRKENPRFLDFCRHEGCKEEWDVEIVFNGYIITYCDKHAQEYLASTKAFPAIIQMIRFGCNDWRNI
jgi:hypothetical protein